MSKLKMFALTGLTAAAFGVAGAVAVPSASALAPMDCKSRDERRCELVRDRGCRGRVWLLVAPALLVWQGRWPAEWGV